MLKITLFLAAAAVAYADETPGTLTVPTRLNATSQVFIEVRINRSDPVWCNLDSGGGDRLYVDRVRAARLGVQATGQGLSSGPNDSRLSPDLRSQATLDVAGLRVPNLPVVLQDRPDEEFACVIGQTTLRSRVVEIDFQTPAVRLHDPAQFRYKGTGQSITFSMDNGSPFVPVSITMPNGKVFTPRVSIDTGGGTAVLMLSKNYADKNKLLNQGLSVNADVKFGSENGNPKVVAGQAKMFTLGKFEIPQPVVHLWQVAGFGGGATVPDGLLCGGFLSRFKLFFDYDRKVLILE